MIRPEHGSVYEWLSTFGNWIAGIIIGVLGKISYELSVKRKLSLFQWIGVCGVSVLTGYIASVWCYSHSMQQQGYFIVPIATLFGEKISAYITDNFTPLFNRIVDAVLNKKK